MSTQIQYRFGQYHTFVSTRPFGLPNGSKVSEGEEIQFDGTNVQFEGQVAIKMMGLRGAVTNGWMVPKADYDPDAEQARPKSAGVRIRPADGGNPMNVRTREVVTTVDAEEQEVGDGVAAHAQRTRDLNARKPATKKASTAGRRVDGAVMAVDDNEGTVVNRPAFKTAAGQAARQESVNLDHASSVISELQSLQVDAMPSVVGRVAAPKNSSKEGFDITNTVGGGTETVDLSGLDSKSPDQVQVVESEGLRFTTTNGPKKTTRPVEKKSEDVRRRVARAVCPDFPEMYDFDVSMRKKIARIQADFEDRPDVIQAIYAAESDDVKTALLEQFPEAFA